MRTIVRTFGLGAFAMAAVCICGCPAVEEIPQTPLDMAYIDARSALMRGARDKDAQVQAYALEALAETEGLRAGEILADALIDTDRLPVASAAAFGIGRIKYGRRKRWLLEIAKDPKIPPRLMCAIIYALHRLGNDEHTGKLGSPQYIGSPNKWVRAETAKVMGMMGDRSAMGPLRGLAEVETNIEVRLQAAEALALLGDEASVSILEGFTKSWYMEDKLISIGALGKIEDRVSLRVLKRVMNNRQRQDPIVRLAAAGSLAKRGDASGYELARRAVLEPEVMLREAPTRRGVRINAAEYVMLQTHGAMALGHMGKLVAVDYLHPLLKHEGGKVRIAAAWAILQLLRDRRPAKAPVPPPTAPPAEPQAGKPTRRPPPLHTSGGKD